MALNSLYQQLCNVDQYKLYTYTTKHIQIGNSNIHELCDAKHTLNIPCATNKLLYEFDHFITSDNCSDANMESFQ